jgi:hypothetical protein
MEQLNTFNYFGNLMSYEKEMDIDNKINNYLKITGIINNMLILKKNFQENKTKIVQYTGTYRFVIQ